MANPVSSGLGRGGIYEAEAEPQASPESRRQVNPAWEFFYRVAERFGIPVVLLVLVLLWVRTDLVQPLLDAHFGFLDKISKAHDAHTEELQNIGQKLDTLIRVADEK
jgi:hypothetical protein